MASQVDITKVLSAHLESEVKKRVEDEVVKKYVDEVEAKVRDIVREALEHWTIGAIEHMKDLLDLSERLKVELVVNDKRKGDK